MIDDKDAGAPGLPFSPVQIKNCMYVLWNKGVAIPTNRFVVTTERRLND